MCFCFYRNKTFEMKNYIRFNLYFYLYYLNNNIIYREPSLYIIYLLLSFEKILKSTIIYLPIGIYIIYLLVLTSFEVASLPLNFLSCLFDHLITSNTSCRLLTKALLTSKGFFLTNNWDLMDSFLLSFLPYS